MNKHTIFFLAPVATFALVFSCVEQVHAMESTSYQLYDNGSNDAEGHPAVSDSYTLDGNRETWTAVPLKSDSFQIVGAFTATSSSSSTSTSSSSSDTTSGGGQGGGGSGANPNAQKSSKAAIVPPPIVPSKPAAPEVAQHTPVPEINLPKPALVAQGSVPTQGITQSGVEIQQGTEYSTALSETNVKTMITGLWQPKCIQRTLPLLLVALVSFLLGYFFQRYRNGYIKIPKRRSQKKHSRQQK